MSSSTNVDSPSNNKIILMVRHTEDYNASRTQFPDKLWENDTFSLQGRDPVLTANGVLAAADGFTENEAVSVHPGYKGIIGGVRGKVNQFQPTLVVASPLRRSLLTTVIACASLPTHIPIIAHPNLREIKSVKVHVKTPNHVKPGAHGVPLSVLRQTLAVTQRGADVDLSLLSTDVNSWHATGETPTESIDRALAFLVWLSKRKEKKIMIFTHGGVLKLNAFGETRFLHGECRRYVFDGNCMVRDDTFNIDQHVIPNDQIKLLKEKDIMGMAKKSEEIDEGVGRKLMLVALGLGLVLASYGRIWMHS